jgi:hypothetical protein
VHDPIDPLSKWPGRNDSNVKRIGSPLSELNGPLVGVTSGNYGSRVYDQVTEGRHLEIAICDDCLLTRQKLVDEVETIHRVDEVSRRQADLG